MNKKDIDCEVQKAKQEAEKIIKKQILIRGEFSHNIISMTLRDLASKHGNDLANELIYNFNLDVVFKIQPVKNKGDLL